MNGHEEENPCCYFHPKEVTVGVCALCLNERLLILASKQGHLSSSKDTSRIHNVLHKKPIITLPRFFALGSFFNRLEFGRQKFEDPDGCTSTSDQEDSFISIKFEDNGVASWDKSISSKMSLEPHNMSFNHNLNIKEAKGSNSVVEHAKPRTTLRWRKRIGHLFQLIRWKRSSKGSHVCHMGGKVEGVKIRKGWIRNLTKRRTVN